VITPPTITPLLVAELLIEGERWPVYVHVIDHPDARVLVDTGMTELHPELADLDPRLVPLSEQAFDLAGVDVVVNTHLHFPFYLSRTAPRIFRCRILEKNLDCEKRRFEPLVEPVRLPQCSGMSPEELRLRAPERSLTSGVGASCSPLARPPDTCRCRG